jgi:hypothetical protein
MTRQEKTKTDIETQTHDFDDDWFSDRGLPTRSQWHHPLGKKARAAHYAACHWKAEAKRLADLAARIGLPI